MAENSPNASNLLGDLIAWRDISDMQKWILEMRASHVAVHSICEDWKTTFDCEVQLGHQAYQNCIICTVLGYHWEKSMNGGQYPFLCDEDLRTLDQLIQRSVITEEFLDSGQIQATAGELRIKRKRAAIKCLYLLRHKGLVKHLENFEKQPSRSWVNCLQEYIDMKLAKLESIDEDRYLHGNPIIITSFFNTHEQLIRNTHPALLFGADETMLEPSAPKKVGVPTDLAIAIQRGIPNMPHITAMCGHNCIGVAVPLFIILKDLRNLPAELQSFSVAGNAWFASSPSAYMTRDLFLVWTVHFINWLSAYRLTLAPALRDKPATLIVDGHHSRECPAALILMKENNINLLILPSHVTHFLQMFDVALASPLKTHFGSIFRRKLKENSNDPSFASNVAKIRNAAIHAVITAWEAVCNLENCVNAAKKTGMYPFSLENALDSPYIHVLTGEMLERFNRKMAYLREHYTIGNKVITNENEIEQVIRLVLPSERFLYLCLLPLLHQQCSDSRQFYCLNSKRYLENINNDCYLLSTPPPFMTLSNAPFLF